jgi:hypothetical protein
MTFDEFVKKYNGIATDYDGGCGVQCVDLAKLYMDKVLGIKIGAIGNAEAYWRRYNELSILNKNFDRIANTPTFIPQKGDIVVWGTKHGKYGHIAVADGVGTTSYFYSYDQNWGGKGQGMTRIKHTYKSGFEGVLRPKAQDKVNGGSSGKYVQGQAVEINTPFYFTGGVEGDLYLYDNKVRQNNKDNLCRVHADTKSLVKYDRIIARATFVVDEDDRCLVQVFNDQFWIKKIEIIKQL